MQTSDMIARRDLLKSGLFAAGAALWPEALFETPASADEKKPPEASTIGRRELLKGLDGMSRVADKGNDPFSGGHNAAAVMASAFFRREQKLDEGTQKEILLLVEARLLTSPIYEPRPKEKADPELVAGLVKDLNAGIDVLRRSGHNIIFANIALKALRDVPEAGTPARVAGLRRMVQSFGTRRTGGSRPRDMGMPADLADETKFVHFVFEEYLKALDLYLNGKGHHGLAGHLLTVGHALLELRRAGYKETANKGVEAYRQFVTQARDGADLGGNKVGAAPPKSPTPRERDFWVGQGKRRAGVIVSSHIIKYPYSLFALAKDVRDDDLKRRVTEKLYHLTAIS
jgi:hypothetical protein